MSEKPRKRKKVYCLRIRLSDTEDWSDEDVFESKKRRDETANICRIIGGYRTHSYERTVS